MSSIPPEETPQDRLARLQAETAMRRRKFEEQEAKKKVEAERLVKEALERKKMERLESDERMRKPWQQPPPPKKEILRAKQKQKPVPLPSPIKPRNEPRDDRGGEDRRKEWREGLKAHIEAARASTHQRDASPPPAAAALTW